MWFSTQKKGHTMLRHKALAAMTAALVIGTIGCGSQRPPTGYSGGRIDPSITTPAEARDARILPVSLMEASDQWSRDLAQDLAELQEVGGAGSPRATVIIGDIMNKTRIVGTDEFEVVQKRMRNNLLQSRYARGRIAWVENRARLAKLAAREGVGTVDNPAGPEAYDPRHTFTLNMDVYRIGRGPVNQYYMETQLVNFATNEIIFAKRYEVKQVQ